MTNEEIQNAICQRLIEGESLRSICTADDMPDRETVRRWLASDEVFRGQYAHARELQAETLADEILEIANTPIIGRKTTTKADGSVETVEGDMIEHRRLQVDARKWVASKLLPKKYGEAALIKHADNEGNRLVELDDVQRAVRLASIAASIAGRSLKGIDND